MSLQLDIPQSMPMPSPSMPMMMKMHMEMQMTFYSDPHFEFLFDSWHVDNHSKYVGAIFGLFFFSLSISVLNLVLTYLEKHRFKVHGFFPRTIMLIAIAVVRFLFISASYILMLAVMTYNTGVFLVISFGISLGFLAASFLDNETRVVSQELSYKPEKLLRDS